MSESKRTTPFSGLLRAISMDADALAAEKGENNMLVKIKRNRERLDQCPTHDFEPQPDWRDGLPLLNRTIHCQRCGGDMKVHDAMVYLRGYAHGTHQEFTTLANRVWPPGDARTDPAIIEEMTP